MARKYLNDFGADDTLERLSPEDPRWDRWKEQIEERGFADYETWDMDLQFYGWLYERLRRFLEVNDLDLKCRKLVFKEREYTKEELVEKMVYGCELVFAENFQGKHLTKEEVNIIEDVAYIWAIVMPHMWW